MAKKFIPNYGHYVSKDDTVGMVFCCLSDGIVFGWVEEDRVNKYGELKPFKMTYAEACTWFEDNGVKLKRQPKFMRGKCHKWRS